MVGAPPSAIAPAGLPAFPSLRALLQVCRNPGLSLISGFLVTLPVFLQAPWVRLAPFSAVLFTVPLLGLALALSICVLTMLWLNRKFQTRLAGMVFAASWVLVTLRMAIESNTGDLVFSVTWYSTAYIIAGAILLSATAMIPPLRQPQREDIDPIEVADA